MLNKLIDYLIERRLEKKRLKIGELTGPREEFIRVQNTLKFNRVMVSTREDLVSTSAWLEMKRKMRSCHLSGLK